MYLPVIILNLNNFDVIQDLIKSIEKNTQDNYNFVFVDQGSTDGSLDYLKEIVERDSNHQLIQLPYNVGTTQGWNIAIRYIRQFNPQYYCFINSDMTVEENWLPPLINCMERHPKCGIVSNRLCDPGNKKFIQNDGADVKNPCHYKMGFNTDFEFKAFTDLSEWVHMGCTLIRAEVFNEIGLFDENFFIYSSDFDFQYRAKWAGFELYHCPDSVAYHKTFHTCTELRKNKKVLDIMQNDGKIFNDKYGCNMHAWFKSEKTAINRYLYDLYKVTTKPEGVIFDESRMFESL